jgi:hypothetical protein
MGVECAVQGGCRGGGAAGRPSDAPRSGGWVRGAREARGERGRVGSTKAVVGQQVLGRGDEISSGRPKNAFVFDFLLLRLGVWWVIPGGLVRKIARPNL